jgi:hypothetical protein
MIGIEELLKLGGNRVDDRNRGTTETGNLVAIPLMMSAFTLFLQVVLVQLIFQVKR